MEVLTQIGIILVVGFIGGKLAKLVKLPNVSGYLIAGLLIGPSLFKIVDAADVASLSILSEIGLAIIAFSIGSEFVIKDMMKLGKRIFWITFAEVVGAVTVVFVVMYFIFQQPFAFSIVIASMSAATAPAATLLVIRQYKANGPMTRTLLPVVALDDVFGIMAFGIAISLAKVSVSGEALSFTTMIVNPLIEIGGSFLLGGALGAILSFITKKAENRDDNQVLAYAFIGIAVGLSNWLGISPLLTNIVMGTVLVNMVKNSKRIFTAVNDMATPFFVLFFTIAGASLDLSILSTVGIIGIGYILARAAGKYIGCWTGCLAMKTDKKTRNFLGLGMFPQGGISIGLLVIVRSDLPLYATAIGTIIMLSILVYETTGPLFAKIAIKKAGEINGDENISKTDIQVSTPVIETKPLEVQPSEN